MNDGRAAHRGSLIAGIWQTATLAFAGMTITGCSEADRTRLFDAAKSPHGDYTLNAYVIDPWFPHGPHHVTLELQAQKTGAREQLLKTDLAHDGVPFTKRNIGLRWTGERAAFVCLSATDRPDKGIQITVSEAGVARTEMRTGC